MCSDVKFVGFFSSTVKFTCIFLCYISPFIIYSCDTMSYYLTTVLRFSIKQNYCVTVATFIPLTAKKVSKIIALKSSIAVNYQHIKFGCLASSSF